MGTKINWSVNVQVTGGPKFTCSDTLEVEAYDPISVTIPAGGTDVEVDVQPGTTEQVKLLLIRPIPPDPPPAAGETLTYSVPGGATDVALDVPQFLVGQGLVGLLDAAPTKLSFTSTLTKDAVVEIFVARSAIASPPPPPPPPSPPPPSPPPPSPPPPSPPPP